MSIDLIGPAVIAASSIVSTWMAVSAIEHGRRNALMQKGADLIADTTRQYASLVTQRAVLANVRTVQPGQVQGYYFDFWGLQLREFDYFRLGLIPREIYAEWCRGLAIQFRDDLKVAGMTFREGWREFSAATRSVAGEFAQFVEQLAAHAEDAPSSQAGQIAQLVREAAQLARPAREGFLRLRPGRSRRKTRRLAAA